MRNKKNPILHLRVAAIMDGSEKAAAVVAPPAPPTCPARRKMRTLPCWLQPQNEDPARVQTAARGESSILLQENGILLQPPLLGVARLTRRTAGGLLQVGPKSVNVALLPRASQTR